jgi:hypothetical protein
LSFLQRHFGADAAASAVIKHLSALIDATRSELTRSMHTLEAGQRKTIAQINRNAVDKEQLDAIRGLSTELLAHESRSVADSRDAAGRRTDHRTDPGLSVGWGAALGCAVLHRQARCPAVRRPGR